LVKAYMVNLKLQWLLHVHEYIKVLS